MVQELPMVVLVAALRNASPKGAVGHCPALRLIPGEK
jgi:hypothetical protein